MRGSRFAALLICLLLLLTSLAAPPVSGFRYIHLWRVQLSGTLAVAGNQTYPHSPLWSYIGNTSWQVCQQLVLDIRLNNMSVVPIRLTSDVDGNPQLVLNLTNPLQPGDVLSWREEWVFTVSDRDPEIPRLSIEQAGSIDDAASAMDPAEYQWFTRSTPLWNTQEPTLLDLAETIREDLPQGQRDNVLALTLATISWIGEHIQYPSSLTEPQYPWELLDSRVGDCDDQSNLLIALLRIYGIPSYLLTGHWYQEGAEYSGFLWGSIQENAFLYVKWRNVAGHGWAMVYVPPWGWLPFDLTFGDPAADPASTCYASLYALGLPMVTIWRRTSIDYVGARRQALEQLYNYSLHRIEYEEWTNLGSVPFLDAQYIASSIATGIALTITLTLFIVLAWIGIRRQHPEQGGTTAK